jgi:hypothetical protein
VMRSLPCCANSGQYTAHPFFMGSSRGSLPKALRSPGVRLCFNHRSDTALRRP